LANWTIYASILSEKKTFMLKGEGAKLGLHIKDHDIMMKLQIQVLAWGSHKIVVWLIPTLPFNNWMSSNTDITKQWEGAKLGLPPSTFQSGEGNCPQLLCP
jgi:hypothetical protein